MPRISESHCGSMASYDYICKLFVAEKVKKEKQTNKKQDTKHKLFLRKGRKGRLETCSAPVEVKGIWYTCSSDAPGDIMAPADAISPFVPVNTHTDLVFLLAWAHGALECAAKEDVSPLLLQYFELKEALVQTCAPWRYTFKTKTNPARSL